VDESPDVSFYVFAEPWLSAPEPDEWEIWRQMEHLRSENLAWRECVADLVRAVDVHANSADNLREAIGQRVLQLGERLAHINRARVREHSV
jgi:hypothetical protein